MVSKRNLLLTVLLGSAAQAQSESQKAETTEITTFIYGAKLYEGNLYGSVYGNDGTRTVLDINCEPTTSYAEGYDGCYFFDSDLPATLTLQPTAHTFQMYTVKTTSWVEYSSSTRTRSSTTATSETPSSATSLTSSVTPTITSSPSSGFVIDARSDFSSAEVSSSFPYFSSYIFSSYTTTGTVTLNDKGSCTSASTDALEATCTAQWLSQIFDGPPATVIQTTTLTDLKKLEVVITVTAGAELLRETGGTIPPAPDATTSTSSGAAAPAVTAPPLLNLAVAGGVAVGGAMLGQLF